MEISRVKRAIFREETNRKRIPLILSLIAAVREQGATIEDFDFAYKVARDEMERRLFSEPLAQICDDIDTAFENI